MKLRWWLTVWEFVENKLYVWSGFITSQTYKNTGIGSPMSLLFLSKANSVLTKKKLNFFSLKLKLIVSTTKLPFLSDNIYFLSYHET
jgi:hypothetical protein